MISLIVNDREVCTDVAPSTPLIDFLRINQRELGTKIGCREGDCGACTVLIGEMKDGALVYRSVTSCLMPIINVNGKHVVTIEGINQPEGLGAIQERFLEHGGTQCGFCTPGFLMALTGFAMSDVELNYYNAIASVDGNICRCTGYKSITTAIKDIVEQLKKRDKKKPIKWLVNENFLPEYFATIEEKVKSLSPAVVDEAGATLFVAGGTDLYVEEFDEMITADKIKTLAEREDLKGIVIEGEVVTIGAATTVEEMRNSEMMTKVFPELERQSRLISSSHIRNMATVGGNIVNGAPIGDITVTMMAMDATLHIDNNGLKREVKLKNFYTGYKTADLKEGEILEFISFELPGKETAFSFEKVSKRTYLDIAVVNSAMRLQLKGDSIDDATFITGGVGATVLSLDKTCEFLKGQKISNDTFRKANEIAQSEISPRSRAEYKRLLVKTQLFNHMSKAAPKALSLEALV